jgi:DNA repair protein RadA/Sms
VGVFEMGEGGLVGVTNPSSLFMSTASEEGPGAGLYPPGCAVAVTVEGTRALCVEVQVG